MSKLNNSKQLKIWKKKKKTNGYELIILKRLIWNKKNACS